MLKYFCWEVNASQNPMGIQIIPPLSPSQFSGTPELPYDPVTKELMLDPAGDFQDTSSDICSMTMQCQLLSILNVASVSILLFESLYSTESKHVILDSSFDVVVEASRSQSLSLDNQKRSHTFLLPPTPPPKAPLWLHGAYSELQAPRKLAPKSCLSSCHHDHLLGPHQPSWDVLQHLQDWEVTEGCVWRWGEGDQQDKG